MMAYLNAEGVELPEHYGLGVNDSLDCWICSAHLAHGGIERLKYTKEHYPALFPEVARRIQRVAAAVSAVPLDKALEISEGSV